jgi:hypothetical protein
VAVGSRSDEGERRGAKLTGVARFSAICALLGVMMRYGVASKIVVVARIGSQQRAGLRLEALVSAMQSEKIPPAWWRSGCGVWRRKERGWRGIYRRRGVDKGLGYGAASTHRTARGDAVFGQVSSKTTSDRWAPPISVLSLCGGIPLWARGDNWAWASLFPCSPFPIFFAEQFFFFYFEIK